MSPSPSRSPIVSGDPNLTTCLYQTDHGVFYLTWSRTFLGGHSLNLFLHSQDYYNSHSSPLSFSSLSSLASFHLTLNTLTFWRKRGSKFISSNIQVLWDLTRAKFESGSEPRSGFYVAVIVDGEVGLLVGDSGDTRVKSPANRQALNREIKIDCCVDEDARLCFCVDSKMVLEVKRLRWKFRGNERVEIDGVAVQISWDVYNWLFQGKSLGHGVFMFRFESDPEEREGSGNDVVLWKPRKCGSGFKGMVEWRKMRRRFVKSKRSSSSSSMSMSMSSASSACSSSVLEWASSADESEYGGGGSSGLGSGHGIGFSLLVYAWIK
ncbi:hypothetical protein HID58_045192 [Brassica napus]|uniref:DUF868 domain-containing protein n=1 Tax=Brassica napus TaxID=3708 RepID=A0ABQ8ASV5_BRANA|nr:hypothetical protein HID58_045192 [Brassica napus]